MARKKLDDRTQLFARVDIQTVEKLKALAAKNGYTYNDEGSIGQMLDDLARIGDSEADDMMLSALLKKARKSD